MFRKYETKRALNLKIGDRVRGKGRIVSVARIVYGEPGVVGVLFARKAGYHYFPKDAAVEYR